MNELTRARLGRSIHEHSLGVVDPSGVHSAWCAKCDAPAPCHARTELERELAALDEADEADETADHAGAAPEPSDIDDLVQAETVSLARSLGGGLDTVIAWAAAADELEGLDVHEVALLRVLSSVRASLALEELFEGGDGVPAGGADA